MTIVLESKRKHRMTMYAVEVEPHIRPAYYRNGRAGSGVEVKILRLSFPRTLWIYAFVNDSLSRAYVSVIKDEFGKLKGATPLFALPMPNQHNDGTGPGYLCHGSASYTSDGKPSPITVTSHLLNSVWNHDLGIHCRAWGGVSSIAAWAEATAKDPGYHARIKYKPRKGYDRAGGIVEQTVDTLIERVGGEAE